MNTSTIGSRLKQIRTQKGYSQEQLADLTKLSIRTIQRIENGETSPRGDSLQRLCRALEIAPEALIDWQLTEDPAVERLLTLTQCSFLVFPLLSIIIPMGIWVLQKDKVKGINEMGKAIVNFQISWNLTFFLVAFLVAFLKIVHVFSLPPSYFLASIGLFYLYNFGVIMWNFKRLVPSNGTWYKPSLPLIR